VTPTEELAAAKYALLTTYRKDGRSVGTAIWIVPLDGALAVWTGVSTGKVKRIRRSPTVTVATCDLRGNNPGPAHEGRATVLDRAGTAAVRAAIVRKYGLVGRFTLFTSRLRGGLERTVGIRIDLG
jgi:PPOX class probable F420-dependent enzyme